MKSKASGWALPILAVLVLAVGTSARAQTPRYITFSGTISDYTPESFATPPSSTPPSKPVAGPWEVRGTWSLALKGSSGKADFSAAVDMERSDQGVLINGGSTPNTGDLNNAADRSAHTHHITMVNGVVTTIPGGFQVKGPATITFNGSFPPPFEPAGTALPILTIQVTGSTGPNSVAFSNISVLFGAPANVHFGTNPLHGVVRGWE